MSWRDALVRSIPLPAPIVVAALLVHRLPSLPGARLAGAALCVGLLTLLLAWRREHHAWRLAAVALAAAGWTTLVAERALADRLDPSQEGRDFVVLGRVASMPMAAERGTRFTFDIDACVPDGPHCPGRRRVRLSWYAFGGADSADGAGGDAAQPRAQAPAP